MNLAQQLEPFTRSVTSDVVLFLVFILVAIILTITTNRDRVFTVPISVYIGVAIASVLPNTPNEWIPLAVFISAFCVGFLFQSTTGLFRILQRGGVLEKIWHRVVWGIISAGMLMAGIAHFFPADFEISSYFYRDAWHNPIAQIFWFLIPFVATFFLRRSRDFQTS
ncbi:MAG: hypothetical protein NUV81_00390 [bacterium]|nr:hypothetical protein [bacterium]